MFTSNIHPLPLSHPTTSLSLGLGIAPRVSYTPGKYSNTEQCFNPLSMHKAMIDWACPVFTKGLTSALVPSKKKGAQTHTNFQIKPIKRYKIR